MKDELEFLRAFVTSAVLGVPVWIGLAALWGLTRKREPGITCPACGSEKVRLVKVKPLAGRVMREHVCRHCGGRITTIES
jgi:hypothetical protein